MTTITINGAMTLGELLAFYRKRSGIEQVEMAAQFGVNRATVSGWENGRTEPKFSQVVAWARITGQPIDALVEAVNAETASTEVNAVSSLSQHSVRHKGLEPLTF